MNDKIFYGFKSKETVCHSHLILANNSKGIFMKDLIGAMLIHIAIAVLLGWFLITLIS
tara:strand:- start:2399 stop:2572 length:174 start_codon:yes stop_codon:yes gene_type:complete